LGPLCLESIRKLHQPPERYLIREGRYPARAEFGGSSRSGRKYILAGSCEIRIGATTWRLQAGEVADLPEGNFDLRVSPEAAVELVSVWELPETMWGGGEAAKSSRE
jgi:hypothetical protein